MHNPFKVLTRGEWILWICSMTGVLASNLLAGRVDIVTLLTTLIGVTGVLYEGKGDIWGQITMIAFSILYGIVSWRFHYWGEMITYMGMALPMAIWAIFTWIRNPSKENAEVVAIQKLSQKQILATTGAAAVVTLLFYFILRALNTPNLTFSTISITTSFMAAMLTMLRSSYYAVWYALNDTVLIILWTLAALEDPGYVPVILNFAIFLFNDIYAFWSWKKREKVQFREKNESSSKTEICNV